MGPFLVRSVVRFGSRTPVEEVFGFIPDRYVEVNSIKSIEISRNKLSMKECFKQANIPQSEWFSYRGDNLFTNLVNSSTIEAELLPYPIIAKRVYGFKGIGMVKVDNHEEMMVFISRNRLDDYYFEKFYNYGKEYRIHGTQESAFLSWRKLRLEEAENRWFFNNSNCSWISETNPSFDSPENFNQLKQHCVEAIKACGLDIGAVDVRVQTQNKVDPLYIILEVNSAPRMGDTSTQLYQQEISKIITNKIDGL